MFPLVLSALSAACIVLALVLVPSSVGAAPPLFPFICSASGSGVASLRVDADGSYNVSVGGATNGAWFTGGDVAVHVAGTWYSLRGGSLSLVGSTPTSGVDPALGPWSALTLSLSAPAASVAAEATFRCYAEGSLGFDLAFPDGVGDIQTEDAGVPGVGGSLRSSSLPRSAPAGEFNASQTPSTQFPSFWAAPLREGGVGYVEWAGRFTSDQSSMGVGLASFVGGASGGPLVLFDASASPRGGGAAVAAVLGPLDEFKSTMLALTVDAGAPPPSCASAQPGTDKAPGSGGGYVGDLFAGGQDACCAACILAPACNVWIYDTVGTEPPSGSNCWLLYDINGTAPAPNRTLGQLAGRDASVLAAGVQGKATSLAPGFTTRMLLVSSSAGITDAVYAYGAALQLLYNTSARRPSAQVDVLSTKLSYWTDNGATYSCNYWGSWVPGNATASDIIGALREWHAQAGFPFRTYQLDPWWYVNADNIPGCDAASAWAAKPSLFPGGLAALNTSFTLYSSYYSTLKDGNSMPQYNWSDSVYFNVGWASGVIAQVQPADSRRFFGDLFAIGATLGMNAFEVDFMDFAYLLFPDRLNSTSAYTTWLTGMNDAAAAAGVAVQMCMDLPSDALLSTQLPSLSNARASEDDFPTNDGRWDITITSLLYGALGLRPFYDDTWSSANNPVNPYNVNDTETFVEVSVALSSLSTGGVGLSDPVGGGNATLAASACAADGTLLQPSRPASPIDASFYGAAVAPAGRIAQALTWGPGGSSGVWPWWVSVLAIDVAAPFDLLPSDLSPPPPAGATLVAVDWSRGYAAIAAACSQGSPAGACAPPFAAASPLHIHTGSENADHSKPHDIFSVAPVFANGYALLGELNKFVRVSVQRFISVTPDKQGTPTPNIVVEVAGFPAPGKHENVNVTLLSSGIVHVATATFETASIATITCIGSGSAASCSCSY